MQIPSTIRYTLYSYTHIEIQHIVWVYSPHLKNNMNSMNWSNKLSKTHSLPISGI